MKGVSVEMSGKPLKTKASKSSKHQPKKTSNLRNKFSKAKFPCKEMNGEDDDEVGDVMENDYDNVDGKMIKEMSKGRFKYDEHDDIDDLEDDDQVGVEEDDDEGDDDGPGDADVKKKVTTTMFYDANPDMTDDLEEEDGEFVDVMNESDEAAALQFLSAPRSQALSLADIIMAKLREKEEMEHGMHDNASAAVGSMSGGLPPKVVQVYTGVGSMLQHYKSGKIPKALKMLPHLKQWEKILWLTRPDLWTPAATFAVTRIFASNLNAKLAQRFYNLVLLEKCRDDIRLNTKLNFHLYLALKKALFKPAAFYKGILLPLVQSGSCTLREAAILGSALLKVSVPAIHSAAVLLRLAELPYSGPTSIFIRILLQKKYALPRRVIDRLCEHFTGFTDETRKLPVVWHASLLLFVQRYKLEFTDEQCDAILTLIKHQSHHDIAMEIRREISGAKTARTMLGY